MNNKINQILEGMIQAIEWLGEDDQELDQENFSPELMDTLKNDAIRFYNTVQHVLNFASHIQNDSNFYVVTGQNFIFSRNEVGVGFWDKPDYFGQAGSDTLQSFCGWRKTFDSIEYYVGDDGLVYA